MFKQPENVQEILAAHEKSIDTVKQILPTLDDARLMTNWSALRGWKTGHDHAQSDAASGDHDEPLDSASRAIGRLSAARRRQGAVQLWAQRR